MKRGMARRQGGTFARVADMSLPPEQRRRKRKTRGRGRKGGGTAQMDHAGGGKADKRRRHGERLLARARGRQ